MNDDLIPIEYKLEDVYLVPTYRPRRLIVERGEGCWVFDNHGKRYLDFSTGIGVNALGYGHPKLLEVAHEQITKCLQTSNLHTHSYQGRLAKKLAEWSGLRRVFFSNSGAEAMEAAIKAARALANIQGRRWHHMVALENSFHGRTTGALAVTGMARYRDLFLPLIPDVTFVPANDEAALGQAITPQTIAIVTETVLGQAGIFPLEFSFLSLVRRLADERKALWIADETQCGLGRTGYRFAYQRYPSLGLPDIVATAKCLGGGMPLGATIFNGKAASVFQLGTHGNTFGGGPLACRLAIAFLDEVDHMLPEIVKRGAYLQQQVRELKTNSSVIREVRGIGLMAGLELTEPAEPFIEAAQTAGLIVDSTRGNIVRLLPPFIADREEIDFACATLRTILQ